MKALWRWLVPAALLRLSFGGDSTAETKNEQIVKDMRVVGGEGSTNISADGSTVSYNTTTIATDHGAVDAGMQLGTKAIDFAAKNAEGLQQTVGTLYAGALSAARDSESQVSALASKVAGDLATAFTDSKAPDKSILMVGGGIVVVGLAAVLLLAKKG